ncbi:MULTISPECIES: TetR/AcrR family transcriptional regulator [Streptomyces]|uniref:TetR family transcriptional regulator n=1 Tax=Streptomyces thermoviolaceus subsp. thermoviolaceus TaxID=66860 RepID=A0ABX0YR06_STRTL|nr:MULTISPECIES: TetR family transcriptional regulator [Streptomyces]WTD46365.1 TetR family transcriptional regulator [Streptomyces thermoviolaceus]NJP13470.1 TetR family transcriptional regulator [Streptomyces thermoviolaceus subsp. thermoviolaceus]RSS05329.1 TetR family transcriptional regulator [Streptomyces sp. WAC00469]GGV66502.1 TetR family transcriptional regulator [Streptomyces thermoviolaceus subsp. apingens]GHA76609.1 TetR family transcriptional regulator [Streptomyces thermoviolaceu
MTATTPGTSPDSAAAPVGRRERKKAATRRAIADAALRLFLERGYDAVGIREIADAADVSTTTLFKHFPVKEALVFDEDADQEQRLLDAVRNRPAGQSVPAALRDHALSSRLVAAGGDDRFAAFAELVATTPALRDYGQKMWLRHTDALAEVIAEVSGLPADDPACRALAHFALEAPRAVHGHDNPREAVTRAFDLLEQGWEALTGKNT